MLYRWAVSRASAFAPPLAAAGAEALAAGHATWCRPLGGGPLGGGLSGGGLSGGGRGDTLRGALGDALRALGRRPALLGYALAEVTISPYTSPPHLHCTSPFEDFFSRARRSRRKKSISLDATGRQNTRTAHGAFCLERSSLRCTRPVHRHA